MSTKPECPAVLTADADSDVVIVDMSAATKHTNASRAISRSISVPCSDSLCLVYGFELVVNGIFRHCK